MFKMSESEGSRSPSIVFDSGGNVSSSPPEQSTSGMSSSSWSNEATPKKHRLCFDNAGKKMEKSQLRENKQNQVIWGDRLKTKSGLSTHATMIREPMPSGGVDAEVNPDFFSRSVVYCGALSCGYVVIVLLIVYHAG